MRVFTMKDDKQVLERTDITICRWEHMDRKITKTIKETKRQMEYIKEFEKRCIR